MERHFLLRAPASFEKNSLSRGANSVRRALIEPSPETIPQRVAGPGELAPLEHRSGTHTGALATPRCDGCEFTRFTDEESSLPQPTKQVAQTRAWVFPTPTASLGPASVADPPRLFRGAAFTRLTWAGTQGVWPPPAPCPVC